MGRVGCRAGEGCRRGRCVAASLALAMLAAIGSAAADEARLSPRAIEVFVASDTTPLEGVRALPPGTSVQIYALDGVERLETELSEGLFADADADADAAQAEALRRLQALDAEVRRRVAQSATGLARAAQYGLDRYPAIVFDGEAVVYGVTDLDIALAHYRAWRARAGP